MKKTQEFNNEVGAFQVESTYHPEENVWTSDYCEPYEWNSEREMRLDMLIHYADLDNDLIMFWDSYDEDDFLQKLSEYENYLSNDNEI